MHLLLLSLLALPALLAAAPAQENQLTTPSIEDLQKLQLQFFAQYMQHLENKYRAEVEGFTQYQLMQFYAIKFPNFPVMNYSQILHQTDKKIQIDAKARAPPITFQIGVYKVHIRDRGLLSINHLDL